MDIDNIFGLFGFNKNNDNKDQEDLELFRNTPLFKTGMFKKMIFNGINFRSQIVKFFSKAEPDIEIDGMEEAGDYMMYTRAYFWVEKCNLDDEEWQHALEHYSDDEMITSLKLCIKYFEEIEEFEKCALLKNIQDYIEKTVLLEKLRET